MWDSSFGIAFGISSERLSSVIASHRPFRGLSVWRQSVVEVGGRALKVVDYELFITTSENITAHIMVFQDS